MKRVGRSEHIVSQHGFGNEVRHQTARRVASLKHEEKNIVSKKRARTLRFAMCRKGSRTSKHVNERTGDDRMKETDDLTKKSFGFLSKILYATTPIISKLSRSGPCFVRQAC